MLLGTILPAAPEAGVVAGGLEEARAAAGSVAVIGKMADTEVAASWAGHEVLNLAKWDIPANDLWVKSVAERGMDVYTASPATYENLWNAIKGRESVFARELRQFTENYGYTWEGDYLRAPAR